MNYFLTTPQQLSKALSEDELKALALKTKEKADAQEKKQGPLKETPRCAHLRTRKKQSSLWPLLQFVRAQRKNSSQKKHGLAQSLWHS